MKEEDMKEIAKLIKLTLTDFDNSAEQVRQRVRALCEKHPLYR
jgi:glycine hydroxymethyltransferase